MAEVFKSVNAELGTTVDGSSEVIYTCPAGTTAIVILCQLANIDGTNNSNSYVSYYDYSETQNKFLAYELVIPADSAVNPIGGKLVLNANDQLRAYASATGDIDITVSVLEIT